MLNNPTRHPRPPSLNWGDAINYAALWKDVTKDINYKMICPCPLQNFKNFLPQMFKLLTFSILSCYCLLFRL